MVTIPHEVEKKMKERKRRESSSAFNVSEIVLQLLSSHMQSLKGKNALRTKQSESHKIEK